MLYVPRPLLILVLGSLLGGCGVGHVVSPGSGASEGLWRTAHNPSLQISFRIPVENPESAPTEFILRQEEIYAGWEPEVTFLPSGRTHSWRSPLGFLSTDPQAENFLRLILLRNRGQVVPLGMGVSQGRPFFLVPRTQAGQISYWIVPLPRSSNTTAAPRLSAEALPVERALLDVWLDVDPETWASLGAHLVPQEIRSALNSEAELKTLHLLSLLYLADGFYSRQLGLRLRPRRFRSWQDVSAAGWPRYFPSRRELMSHFREDYSWDIPSELADAPQLHILAATELGRRHGAHGIGSRGSICRPRDALLLTSLPLGFGLNERHVATSGAQAWDFARTFLTLIHEIGHVLGATHSGSGIMHPQPRPEALWLSQESVRQIRGNLSTDACKALFH